MFSVMKLLWAPPLARHLQTYFCATGKKYGWQSAPKRFHLNITRGMLMTRLYYFLHKIMWQNFTNSLIPDIRISHLPMILRKMVLYPFLMSWLPGKMVAFIRQCIESPHSVVYTLTMKVTSLKITKRAWYFRYCFEYLPYVLIGINLIMR